MNRNELENIVKSAVGELVNFIGEQTFFTIPPEEILKIIEVMPSKIREEIKEVIENPDKYVEIHKEAEELTKMILSKQMDLIKPMGNA